MISINIITRNRAHLIKKSIESIISQTYKNWECIIIDDDSKDNTKTVVNSFYDKRIKYYKIKKQKNLGSARNIGLRLSTKKYIAILDDDDYWIDNNKLKNQLKILENNNFIITGTRAYLKKLESKDIIGVRNVPTNNKKIKKKMTNYCPFIHSTVMFSREKALSVGGYNEINLGQDYSLWLKLGLIGKMHNTKEISTIYITNNSYDKNSKKIKAKNGYNIVKPYFNKYPNSLKNNIIWFYRLLFN